MIVLPLRFELWLNRCLSWLATSVDKALLLPQQYKWQCQVKQLGLPKGRFLLGWHESYLRRSWKMKSASQSETEFLGYGRRSAQG